MKKQIVSNVKLGFFVIAAVSVLALSLYMIGKNRSFFGSNFEIKARFRDVNGLMRGNNVRFSGIQAGTVKGIEIVNDTTIEVVMLITSDAKKYIHKNSFASIGSEGLMGNKIINIYPNPQPAPPISAGDMLLVAKETKMDDMLATLDRTNNNVAIISEDLRTTIKRINNNNAIWMILDDTSLAINLQRSMINVHQASMRIDNMSLALNEMIQGAKNGEGTIGLLFKDTGTAGNLRDAIKQINGASHSVNDVIKELNDILVIADTNISNGKGLITTLLKDSSVVRQLHNSLDNIEQGTASFNEDMNALQHNILLKGYFRKKARKAGK